MAPPPQPLWLRIQFGAYWETDENSCLAGEAFVHVDNGRREPHVYAHGREGVTDRYAALLALALRLGHDLLTGQTRTRESVDLIRNGQLSSANK